MGCSGSYTFNRNIQIIVVYQLGKKPDWVVVPTKTVFTIT
jgi:hypothetical protein